MRQDIKREMLEYFRNISSPTKQEDRFRLHLESEVTCFDITSLSREDIYDRGYDASKISDAQMERLADKMADCYCDVSFWIDLGVLLDKMNIPLSKGKTRNNGQKK